MIIEFPFYYFRVLQLSHGQKEDAGAPQFAQVFTIFWLGVITVSINTKLLGGTLYVFPSSFAFLSHLLSLHIFLFRSFCQTVCVLGYCIVPLVTGLVINVIIKLLTTGSAWVLLIRLIIVFIGLAYSLFSAATFLAPSSKPNRVVLVVYPLCLFYFFIGWLVFVNTGPSRL